MMVSPAASATREQHGRSEQAGEEQQGQRLQLAAGAFDDDQIEGVEQPGEGGEQVAAKMRGGQFRAAPHQHRRSRRRRAPAPAPGPATAICAQATAPRRRRRSWRYCRTGWRCRAWSAGCPRARRRGRRRRRKRRARWRSSAPCAGGAPAGRTSGRAATGREAPAPSARSRPRPARRRCCGPGKVRRRARDCRPGARGRRGLRFCVCSAFTFGPRNGGTSKLVIRE